MMNGFKGRSRGWKEIEIKVEREETYQPKGSGVGKAAALRFTGPRRVRRQSGEVGWIEEPFFQLECWPLSSNFF